jgi:hypothetical protein
MNKLKTIAILSTSTLALAGCAQAPLMVTDENCGVIQPDSPNPTLVISALTDELSASISSELSWQVSDLPAGETQDSIYSGTVTTAPFAGFVDALLQIDFNGDPDDPVLETDRAHWVVDTLSTVENHPFDADSGRFSTDHQLLGPSLLGPGPDGNIFAEFAPLFAPLLHMPVTIFASCSTDVAQAINDRNEALNLNGPVASSDDVSSDVSRPLDLTDTSSLRVWPGYADNFLNVSQTDSTLRVEAAASPDDGWVPLSVALAPWFGLESLDYPIGTVDDFASLSDFDRNWLALLSLGELPLATDGLSDNQPLVFNAISDESGDSLPIPGATLDAGALVIDVNTPLTARNFADRIFDVTTDSDGDGLMWDVSWFDHLVVYAVFGRPLDGGVEGVEIRYSFETLNTGSELSISSIDPASLYDVVTENLLGDSSLANNVEINGVSQAAWEAGIAADNIDDRVRFMIGEFSGGAGLLEIDSGLMVNPGYEMTAFDLRRSEIAGQLQILNGSGPSDSEVFFGPGANIYQGDTIDQEDQGISFLEPADGEDRYPDSLIGALAQAVDQVPAPGFTLYDMLNGPASALYDPVTISFDLDPTAEYLKLDFALATTETGTYDGDVGQWIGDVIDYTDGIGIFVKSNSESWLNAVNCAAIPTTNSYLSMANAGIVPPDTIAASRAEAAANHRALALETAAPGYQFDPERLVDPTLGVAVDKFIPAPQIAYSTEEFDSVLGFVTTTMTCVVDVSAIRLGGEDVSIGIAIANVRDPVLPPVLMLSAASIRFSESQVAATTIVEQEIIADMLEQAEPTSPAPSSTVAPAPIAQPAPVAQTSEPRASIRRISDTEAKLYLLDVVDAGKVQFMLNGRELGWVRAIDATDPKLRVADSGPMAGRAYFVRTAQLEPGKNVLEIYVDGERVRRVAYGR